MQILGVRVWTGDGDRVIIIIIITDLYSAFRSEDTEALKLVGCLLCFPLRISLSRLICFVITSI